MGIAIVMAPLLGVTVFFILGKSIPLSNFRNVKIMSSALQLWLFVQDEISTTILRRQSDMLLKACILPYPSSVSK